MSGRRRRNALGWTEPAQVVLAGAGVLLGVLLTWAAPAPEQAPAVDTTLVVDPNTAPPQVLLALPRLGPVLVTRFVEERSKRPFRSISDIDARVRGIGPATVIALRPHFHVRASSPSPRDDP